MKIGFIGLGRMGSGIAANLLKAGHEVVVYNRTRAKAEPLAAQGGEKLDWSAIGALAAKDSGQRNSLA